MVLNRAKIDTNKTVKPINFTEMKGENSKKGLRYSQTIDDIIKGG